MAPEHEAGALQLLREILPPRLIGESYDPPVPEGEVLREFVLTWGQLRRARAIVAAADGEG